MGHFLSRLRYYLTARRLRRDIEAARRLLSGSSAWYAMDELGVPGFGTDLIRIDFAPKMLTTLGARSIRPPLAGLENKFQAEFPQFSELLDRVLTYAPDCNQWPLLPDPDAPSLPCRENDFLTRFDQLVLYGLLQIRKPSTFVEIGSGMSTRVANQARLSGAFSMNIVSIDPEPRVEVDSVSDRIVREHLECVNIAFLSTIHPNSVVFVDGSHRCFPGSDVTVFFLEVLPHLPKGTLVHVHDIFLPYDYPAAMYPRLWSEQYILAAFLLGGAHKYRVILPCAFLSANPMASPRIAKALQSDVVSGSGFWLEKVA